jgi:hypothetical protein
MANITINNRKNAIEITKGFEKKARVFNSKEYNELKAAKKDFPKYDVVIKASSKRTIQSRIKMKDIIYYVEKKGTEEEKKNLKELRGKSVEEAKKANAEGYIFEIEESASFAAIKEWFFNTYPAVEGKVTEHQKKIDSIIEGARAAVKVAATD